MRNDYILRKTMNVLSLFSGCGGMDLGFEGGFTCLSRSVNKKIHPNWVENETETWATLKRTAFNTVFANDIRKDAQSAWVNYFSKRKESAKNIYVLASVVDLVKKAKLGGGYSRQILTL